MTEDGSPFITVATRRYLLRVSTVLNYTYPTSSSGKLPVVDIGQKILKIDCVLCVLKITMCVLFFGPLLVKEPIHAKKLFFFFLPVPFADNPRYPVTLLYPSIPDTPDIS